MKEEKWLQAVQDVAYRRKTRRFDELELSSVYVSCETDMKDDQAEQMRSDMQKEHPQMLVRTDKKRVLQK